MKPIRLIVAMSLLASPPAIPAAAAMNHQSGTQAVNQELLEFCYDLIASGEFSDLSLGECMSFNLPPDAGWRAHFCDFLRETDQLAGTYSECIRFGE